MAFLGGFEVLQGRPIGLFGAGHLGRAIALALLRAGLPQRQLLICHRGTPETQAALTAEGLADCVLPTAELVQAAKVVFYLVRPQSYLAIQDYPLAPDALFVSFLAGIPLARIPVLLSEGRKIRVMTSAPDTWLGGDGIAALWPGEAPILPELLASLGMEPLVLASERAFHAFTALGPCLPIALTYCDGQGIPVDWKVLAALGAKYDLPGYGAILAWARRTRRQGLSPKELQSYLAQAATPGGITEAILVGLEQQHLSLGDALERGIGRSLALAG